MAFEAEQDATKARRLGADSEAALRWVRAGGGVASRSSGGAGCSWPRRRQDFASFAGALVLSSFPPDHRPDTIDRRVWRGG
jgi:hypothetical protein